MKGYSFCFERSNYFNLKDLTDCFGIPSLVEFISPKVPFPKTIEESLHFISNSYSECFESQFHQSLSIIVQNFSLLSYDDLNKLSNSNLLKIISSDDLQIESEDYLFRLIAQMIEEDKNRFILMNYVHLEFVSSPILKNFFQNVVNHEIDFDFLESIKKKVFEDYSDQEKLSKIWKNKFKILSRQEIDDIFDILNSYFKEETNPIELVKILIEQNKRQKNEIEELKNSQCKGKLISYQNEVNGILQDLKKTERNSISLQCSGFANSKYGPENVFNESKDNWFCSRDQSNSWLTVHFTHKKILLSGYFVRCHR
jgi:hypothetical protein